MDRIFRIWYYILRRAKDVKLHEKVVGVMELEMWIDILGYEGLYQISSIGRVKNVKSNKILTCGTTSEFRYKQAALCRDGKRKCLVCID